MNPVKHLDYIELNWSISYNGLRNYCVKKTTKNV